MNIIGISAHFHDAACCLLRDGHLVAAAQQERFSRVKHDPSLPAHAFRFCLAEGGITIREVDAIAYYEMPIKKLSRQLWMGLPGALHSDQHLQRLDPGRAEREIRSGLGFEGRIEFVEHHLSHAASSFYFSGFPEAAILTMDGVGEWATTTYGKGAGADLEIFEEIGFPHSVGLLYSTITNYLGFQVNDGEYKVMGLAPYGNPCYVSQIQRMIRSGQGGQFKLDLSYFDFMQPDRMFSSELPELLDGPPRVPESDLTQRHRDIARSLQVVFEEFLLAKVRYLHTRVPSANLAMAGGAALNCVANARILREGPFKRIFVPPAPNDSGGALGAAAIVNHRLSGEAVREPLNSAQLGPRYSSEEVQAILEDAGVNALDFRGREPELLKATVQRLASQQVVGWFQGRMEFGPRALGARSILADPRNSEMRNRINAMVKKRESFRPFAPAVLEEKAHLHFDLDHASPFMLETCPVTSSLDLPAVTHVDRSARVQTVSAADNPRFSKLLAAFEAQTGCPVLLNTSFNLRGEPIVCTPENALLRFLLSSIDVLVIEDFLVDRSGFPTAYDSLRNYYQKVGGGSGTTPVYPFF